MIRANAMLAIALHNGIRGLEKLSFNVKEFCRFARRLLTAEISASIGEGFTSGFRAGKEIGSLLIISAGGRVEASHLP